VGRGAQRRAPLQLGTAGEVRHDPQPQRNGRSCQTGSPPRRLWELALRGLALLVVLVASPFLALPAGASDEVESPIADLECGPTEAELEDIGFIADQDGLHMDEAVERLGWQSCFAEVATHLRTTYPKTYAGAAIVDGGRGAWIAFAGQVPDEAVRLAAAMPVAVQLIGDRAFSERDLDDARQSIVAEVARHGDIVTAGGSHDVETGEVTIQAQPRETLDESERAQLLEAIRRALPAIPGIAVEVLLVDELGGLDDGGAAGSSWSRAQTVGFVALSAGATAVLLIGLIRTRQRRGETGPPRASTADTA
jgi:hypothetical protein